MCVKIFNSVVCIIISLVEQFLREEINVQTCQLRSNAKELRRGLTNTTHPKVLLARHLKLTNYSFFLRSSV